MSECEGGAVSCTIDLKNSGLEPAICLVYTTSSEKNNDTVIVVTRHFKFVKKTYILTFFRELDKILLISGV